MEAKVLDEEISQYLPQLDERQKEAVLNIVKSFANGQGDWWDEMDEEMKEAIDLSLLEMNEGKLTPHNVVMEKYQKWIK